MLDMESAIAAKRPWGEQDDAYAAECRLSAMSEPLSELLKSVENL